MVGGQGQPAAERVAESALRAAALRMFSLAGSRRLPDRQCLIPRREAWDPFGMEKGRRSVHGTRLVKSVLGGTVLSWRGQAHYPCWNCAQAGKAGLGSSIFWTNTLASCCLLSDTVEVAESGGSKIWEWSFLPVRTPLSSALQHSETSSAPYPQPATNQCHITEL